MLAQTLVLLAAIAVFAVTAIAGVAGVARARAAESARALIAPGTETALAQYIRTIGATIAAQLPPNDGTAPPPPIDALNGRTPFAAAHIIEQAPPSPLTLAVDITPTAAGVPTCGNTTAAGPDIAVNAQCSPFVQESRLALDVVAVAGPADASGAVTALAQGRTTITLRLFAQPPYAMLSGAKDAALPADPHEGDTAGYGNALATFLPTTPLDGDTTIHVVYQCTPALGDCSNSLPHPADAPTNLPWTNGN